MRPFFPCLTAGLLLAAAGAEAQVPLPQPRPDFERAVPIPVAREAPPARIAKPRTPTIPQASGAARSDLTPPPEVEAAHCTELLAAGVADLEMSASVSGISGDALCGDVSPVRMTAVRLPGGGRVELRPAAVARCEMAHRFAEWVRDDVAPTVRLLGTDLRRLEIAASYHCRPRNNVSGARLSEHGLANAIDVSALLLANGRRIAVEDPDAPFFLFAEMRTSSCARFTTVLGPGSDAAHADHIHVDLARRRGGFRICQWPHAEWHWPDAESGAGENGQRK